jgi:hypothetical protein
MPKSAPQTMRGIGLGWSAGHERRSWPLRRAAVMDERSCLQCRFGSLQSHKRGTPAPNGYVWCVWLWAQNDGGDRIPVWAHEALVQSAGLSLGQADRADDCPAFEEPTP